MALQGKTTVIKRGNTADNNLLLGAKGEIVVNETTKSLRVHTGTRGGTELLRSDMANLDTGVSSVLDFNGARLRDIGSPVASTDAATKAYVDAQGGGGSSTLSGLTDVVLGGTITSGELLQYDGSAWINSTISLSDLSDSSTVATKTYVDTEIGNLGTAANYNVGTGANNVVQLDGSSRLPAVDGSLLTGVNISGGLLATNNLSDLSNSATARSNLGLGSVATLNSNAVLQVSNNLSDLGNVGTARTNLGLGDVATLSTGMSSGQVPLAQDVAILTGGKIAGSVLPLDVITTIGLSALKDVPNGIAGLDSSGHLASSVLPDLAITHVSSGLLADRPAATVDNTGDVYIATDTSQTFISTGSDWSEILNLNSASIADLIGDMDNVKLSFGAIVNSESAAWVGFDSTNYLDSGTDLKTSLEALDTQIKTNSDALLNVLTTSSTLNDLSGVIISGSPNGKFLKNNGTDWVDNVIDHSDVNGLGSSALKTAGTSANNVLLLDNNGEFSGSLITDSSVTSSKISGNIPVAIVSGLGTSATLDVGTTANKVVQLNGSAQLPAVSGVNLTGITASQVSGISGTYAPLASPALTGTPTAPTASPGTSTTQIATTAFVQSEAYTDTDAVAAVNYALANGYNITISGTVNITGTATASTQSANDSSTKVATTEYVQNELSAMLLNDLSDVVITGTPSNNQVLKYDTGTSKWVNGTSSASVSNLDDIGDVATGGAVDGDILKYDGSHWVNKKPSIALNYVALTDASITLASGKYYVYSSATDTTQKNILTLPSNGIISNTGGETIYVSIVDSIADTNNNYVLKAGTNTRIIYEDVILAESAELALSSTGLYTITHVIRDGEKRYYVTLNKSVSSNSSYTDSDAVDALVNALDDTNITYTLSSGQILSSINTSSISNNKLIHSSITIGSNPISLGGTLALSGLSFDGTTLSVNSISLDGLSDVALGTLSTGQVLKYDGTNWVNGTDNTGGGGGVGLGDNNTWTGENTFNGSYLLVESVSGEDKFKVNNSGNTIDIFTPITLVQDAYLYVKFDGTSSMSDFFYIFTSPDNGITRQVVPLTLIQDSGTDYLQKITSWNMGGAYTFDYSVYSANGFMQYTNTSNVPNASFKRDPSLTYYISSWNRNQFSTFDFGLAISDSNDGLNLTYVDLAGSGFDSNMVESIYEVVDNVPTLDATLDDPSYTYDRRMTKVANFDKAYDLTTLARLEVTSIAEVGKLIVNGSTTLGGAIDLGSSGTATTPSANDNSTKVATTAYVQTELSAMVLNDLSDTTVFSPATGETLRYNGSAFVNSKLSFSDLSSTGNAALLTADNNFTGNLKSYGGNLNVYSGKNETFYLFVKYNSTSRNDAEYFYVFSSSDNGVTRESVPLTLIQDTGTDYLEEDTSQGYKRYLASQASAYTNTGTSANAAVVLDMSKTYYFTIRTDNDNTSPNLDFQIYISDDINATGFTYNNVLPYGGGFYIDDNPYTITINSSAWSTISLSSPTSVTNASSLLDSTQVLSIDNDTGNIVSNGYIQLKEQGIAPTPVSTYAQIYAKVDASDTEIYVQDSAGNNTKLSPHNEEGEWEYYSYNKRTGKSIRINMEKMIRTLEAITGEKFIIEE